MVATIEFERYVTHTGVFGVVIGELCNCKEPCPVFLLPIHESPKVSFYDAILLLRLTVCLRVKHGRKSCFDLAEVGNRGPELGRKNCYLVIDDRVWEPVMLYHQVYDDFCYSRSIDGDFD